MTHRTLPRSITLIVLTLLAACGATAPASPPAPATLPPPAAATLDQSRTPEGYHVLGRADAPVTIVMYSDFF